MKLKISLFIPALVRSFHIVILVFLFLIPTTLKAQLPTAQKISEKMTVGCNLGNTLEAICGESAWGAGKTSQRLIDSIKVAGFNAVRLPCAWFCHSDTVTNVINAAWIARVKEVVDYCIKDSMYVILNIHWDSGWLENHVTVADSARVNKRQKAYWSQIANYFKNYGEHLLFASANEPNVKDATGMAVLLLYHQTFIDAVRATGVNNSSRTLIVQGPSTDIDLTYKLMNIMPKDQIENRLMAEVHYYTPYQFCLMSKDENWGKMFYYWGKGNHSATDVTRNATWGEESDMDRYLGMMKTKFIDKGIPVIIGEYGAYKRKLSPPSDQALNHASVEYFHKYFVKSATSRGIIPFFWDTPGGLFNRSTGAVLDKNVLKAVIQGANGETVGMSVPKADDTKLYPNPFTSAITLKAGNHEEISGVSIFDMMGRQVETVGNSEIKGTLTIGSRLNPGIYVVQVSRKNETKTYKVFKR